jgi:hypothetical protein
MKNISIIILALFLCATSCKGPFRLKHIDRVNEAEKGFDLAGSDVYAIALADSVMNAHGGRYNWDNTRFIKWNFFGYRTLIYDKMKNRVRIEIVSTNTKIITDLGTLSTKLEIGNKVILDKDSLAKYGTKAYNIFCNDSYWLLMPYKLKDAGVTLKYIGKLDNSIGAKSEVIEVTFKSVGVTPNNKYYIYINPRTYMVTQWDFFEKSTDTTPEFSNIWSDYKAYSRLFLSGNRGKSGYISNIGVYAKLPETVFNTFTAVDWTKMK